MLKSVTQQGMDKENSLQENGLKNRLGEWRDDGKALDSFLAKMGSVGVWSGL